MLIIVCGLPGTGKSSFSKILAKTFSGVHLNSDVIRKELFEKPQYTEDEKKKVYAEMARQTDRLLKEGGNVILDATFYRKEYRKMMVSIAENLGVKTYKIKCILPENEIRKRLSRRMKHGKNISDADYDVYKELKDAFEPLESPYLEIDCSMKKAEMIARTKQFIGEAHE